MLQIEFSKNAEASFETLDKSIQIRIITKLKEIQNNPEHFIKALTNSLYDKIRIGDYRLLTQYNKQENKLYIRELDHRKRIYK